MAILPEPGKHLMLCNLSQLNLRNMKVKICENSSCLMFPTLGFFRTLWCLSRTFSSITTLGAQSWKIYCKAMTGWRPFIAEPMPCTKRGLPQDWRLGCEGSGWMPETIQKKITFAYFKTCLGPSKWNMLGGGWWMAPRMFHGKPRVQDVSCQMQEFGTGNKDQGCNRLNSASVRSIDGRWMLINVILSMMSMLPGTVGDKWL